MRSSTRRRSPSSRRPSSRPASLSGRRARSEPGVELTERGKSREERLAERVGLLAPEQRARLAQALRERSGRPAATIQRRQDTGPAPLSYAQEALWFLEQWNPGAPTNHGARVLRFQGKLEIEALEAALGTVVRRHESLHSVCRVVDGRPVQAALEEVRLALP